jgi:hypothetical protein
MPELVRILSYAFVTYSLVLSDYTRLQIEEESKHTISSGCTGLMKYAESDKPPFLPFTCYGTLQRHAACLLKIFGILPFFHSSML